MKRWSLRPLAMTLPLAAALAAAGCNGDDGQPGAGAAVRAGDESLVPDAAPSARVRRVILITCDTLRADRLGAWGSTLGATPALDELARGSLVFDEAYSSVPVTVPSLSSLMTGKLPDELGVSGGNGTLMAASVVTLAELAAGAGLPTGAVVSNWVLRRRDFAPPDVGLPQGFAHFDDRMPHPEPNRAHFQRLAPETSAAAIEWLEERRAADEDRFFFWVHYQDPHGPYTPPADLVERFALTSGAQTPAPEPLLPAGVTHKGKGQIPAYQVLGEERRPGAYRDRYDAEVACFDAGLSVLLGWLAQAGWIDDALLVFTADHGESLGEHDYWFCHGENVYREELHVPLLLRAPGVAPGRRPLASHLDLFPTIADALGLALPQDAAHPLRGRSLLAPEPQRTDGSAPRRLVHTLGLPGTENRWEGISDGRWRLVVERGTPPRLYDITTDPGELHDLSAREPQVRAELAGALRDTLRHAQRGVPWGQGQLSDEDRAAFGALGYVEGDASGDAKAGDDAGATGDADDAHDPRDPHGAGEADDGR